MIEIGNINEIMSDPKFKRDHLDICSGDIFGILTDGTESKQKLCNIFGGLEIPNVISIKIDGIDTKNDKYIELLRRKVGILSKDLFLLDDYNVEFNIILPKIFSEQQINHEKLYEIAKRYKIEENLTYYPAELDKEKKVYTIFARFIFCEYKIIVADVDFLNEEQLFELITLCKTYNKILIFITEQADLLQLSHTFSIIKRGKIEQIEQIYYK